MECSLTLQLPDCTVQLNDIVLICDAGGGTVVSIGLRIFWISGVPLAEEPASRTLLLTEYQHCSHLWRSRRYPLVMEASAGQLCWTFAFASLSKTNWVILNQTI